MQLASVKAVANEAPRLWKRIAELEQETALKEDENKRTRAELEKEISGSRNELKRSKAKAAELIEISDRLHCERESLADALKASPLRRYRTWD